MSTPDDVTRLLQLVTAGDRAAEEELYARVYQELRQLAAAYLRGERPGHTLQATALVNEAYLRLVGQQVDHWQGRSQFFGVAAKIMRRILTDHARRKRAGKRGGGAAMVPLDDHLTIDEKQCELAAELDEALERLAAINERMAKVVELRYFGGLTEDEIAEMLGISTRTVKRLWQTARVWLLEYLSSPNSSSSNQEK